MVSAKHVVREGKYDSATWRLHLCSLSLCISLQDYIIKVISILRSFES